MTTDAVIRVWAGDTEPLEILVGALRREAGTGVYEALGNLDDLSSAALYLEDAASGAQHVDGAACTVADSDSMKLSFDPVDNGPAGGDAFGAAYGGRTYQGYVLMTFTDGSESRWPDPNQQPLGVVVRRSQE